MVILAGNTPLEAKLHIPRGSSCFGVKDIMKNAFLAMSAKVIGDTGEKQLLTEEEFLLLISQECRRAERSKQKFILALIDGTVVSSPNASAIISPIGAITRETDALGGLQELHSEYCSLNWAAQNQKPRLTQSSRRWSTH